MKNYDSRMFRLKKQIQPTSYFDDYKSYKVDLVNKKVTIRPRVTVVLGYKDSYTNYFDTDQQAQAYVDDLIAKSKKEFPSNN